MDSVVNVASRLTFRQSHQQHRRRGLEMGWIYLGMDTYKMQFCSMDGWKPFFASGGNFIKFIGKWQGLLSPQFVEYCFT